MDSSTVSNRQGVAATRPAPPTRNRSGQDHARRAAVDDAVRQEQRAINNREASRRLAQSAFRESLEEERIRQHQNMQAGVEKMVRSVVRKESAQTEQSQAREVEQQNDPATQAGATREKLDAVYGNSSSDSPRDEDLRPSPSQRQQQRAIENYQQSNRNSIDRTVELVV